MAKEHPEWWFADERDDNGRFKKGVSGNPKGRPSGRTKVTLAIEALLGDEGERLTRRAVEMALAGDPVALRLCLERICPVRKSAPVVFPLPAMKSIADLPAAIGAVSQAMSLGELTPDEAMSVTAVLDVQRKAFELSNMEQRLRALEEAQGTSQKPAEPHAKPPERRLAALEQAMRVTQEGHVIVIRGGVPGADPTETEIAAAVSRSKAERGQLMILGGSPE